MSTKYYLIATFGLSTILLTGCKKLIEVVPPVFGTSGDKVYDNDATAIDVVTGIYTNISAAGVQGNIEALSLYPELSADELSVFGSSQPNYLYYYRNALTNTNYGGDFWTSFYDQVYTINAAIEGLGNAPDLTPAVQQQLMGESLFMRAFCYFYLINLYGNVPLVISTDYSVNRLLPRAPQAMVWQQITADLEAAQSLLSPNYLDGTLLTTTNNRVRPTKGAANGLLARAFLYQKQWDSAEVAATRVINQTAMYVLDTLNGVFLANSNEAIWQLQPVNYGQNTSDAILFILPPSGPDGYGYPVYMNPILLNSFEPGDQRRINWVDSVIVAPDTFYFPYKYKVNVTPSFVSEYTMVLRLGEQYLIRAEASAQLGNIPGSQADLNKIRNRAGLSNTQASTSIDLQTAILHERQVELFTEWGQRWLDLKRTGTVDSVMSIATPQKGGIWADYKQWYPIYLQELFLDPSLVQNSGYGQ